MISVLIRTTIDPRVEREVDDSEAAVLEHQGLLWKGTRDELQALLDRDPVRPGEQRVVLPRETPVPAPITSVVADPAPAPAKTSKEN